MQVATSDGSGRLVLLDKSPARALLLDPRTGEQTTLASFPEGSIPNFGAWGPDGALYVTDYARPMLWRDPAGRRHAARVAAATRASTAASSARPGMALAADRRTLLVAVQSQAGGAGGNPSTGRLFTVPIQPDGTPGDDAPAVGEPARRRAGRLRDREVGRDLHRAARGQPARRRRRPTARERERFPAAPGTGDNGSPVPFDGPSSVRFLGTRLMVANQAYFTGDRTRHAILDVEAGEPGLPELSRRRRAATPDRPRSPRPSARSARSRAGG